MFINYFSGKILHLFNRVNILTNAQIGKNTKSRSHVNHFHFTTSQSKRKPIQRWVFKGGNPKRPGKRNKIFQAIKGQDFYRGHIDRVAQGKAGLNWAPESTVIIDRTIESLSGNRETSGNIVDRCRGSNCFFIKGQSIVKRLDGTARLSVTKSDVNPTVMFFIKIIVGPNHGQNLTA